MLLLGTVLTIRTCRMSTFLVFLSFKSLVIIWVQMHWCRSAPYGQNLTTHSTTLSEADSSNGSSTIHCEEISLNASAKIQTFPLWIKETVSRCLPEWCFMCECGSESEDLKRSLRMSDCERNYDWHEVVEIYLFPSVILYSVNQLTLASQNHYSVKNIAL